MRVDLYLYQNGHSESREQARRLIEAGAVRLDGVTVKKPSLAVDENMTHEVEIVKPASERYVSRGGLKLERALEYFHISPEGLVALDIGASTGGFTDCMLQRGARRVYAVDSGEGQLHPRLRADSRVVNIEKCNARALQPSQIGEPAALAVMDVSFISQTCILPVIPPLLTEDGMLISLIKPQFEAGRGAVGKGGIVRRREHREAAVRRVLEGANAVGLTCVGLTVSPITGGDGNVEYLALFCRHGEGRNPIDDGTVRAVTEIMKIGGESER
jgi:23S rRNA (cytidine1920-2'-O)/16S rRNA (cytidine1409-2'-O)-methyltransferase